MNRANFKKMFPSALASVMEHNQVNQVELSKRTGIAVSRVNNYLQGKYRTIRPDHIGRILESVTTAKVERANLTEAYAMDLLPDSAKGLVAIRVDTMDMASWYLQRNRLPSSFAKKFEALYRLCVDHPKARAYTDVWIELLAQSVKA